MKSLSSIHPCICISVLCLFSAFTVIKNDTHSINGAWVNTENSVTHSLLIADGYCMVAVYDKANKKFISSWGGSFSDDNKQVKLKIEFNSNDKTQVGKIQHYTYSLQNNSLITNGDGQATEWKRIDNGKASLAGNWRITQRKDGDKMTDIPVRARRTLKLLTGSRFQWAAINIETGEFFGTGGGTYTFTKGKYTEHIEFFSRDDTRVGTSLKFDGKIENNNWIHSGSSSTGAPMYEVWSRFKN